MEATVQMLYLSGIVTVNAGSGRSLTSMTSVWACLVQKACGGVVQLTATKLLGFRSIAGVIRSVQAG